MTLLYKVLPRVFAYAEARIRFKSLHLTLGLTLPVQRANRYFNTTVKTSFYKILHKTWIATPLTCQYLIQKIPLMSFLCRRSGFYLCRIFNEGAWSLWLWHIQLTRHRTHSEQYTKQCYHYTTHFTRTQQLLHELIILLPDHSYFWHIHILLLILTHTKCSNSSIKHNCHSSTRKHP